MLRAVPLDPSPEEGRSLLRRELLDPRYREDDPIGAVVDWLRRTLEGGLSAARDTPAVSALVAASLLVLLLVALGLLGSRARRTGRVRAGGGAVLGAAVTPAAQLRAEAERLLAQGRCEEAAIAAYRALARRQVEADRLPDDPGATAREVATTLADALPGTTGETGATTRARLLAAAGLFDDVLYGALPAGADQVRDVLGLDDHLRTAGDRPAAPAR